MLKFKQRINSGLIENKIELYRFLLISLVSLSDILILHETGDKDSRSNYPNSVGNPEMNNFHLIIPDRSPERI